MPQNQKRIVKDPRTPANYVVAQDPTANKVFVEFLKATTVNGRSWRIGEIAGFDLGIPAQQTTLNSLLQSTSVRYWTP